MKKALKVAVVLFIIAAVVLAGLTFFARSYLTDERIRAYLVVTAEKSLGRKVGLGAIQVSIFKGISVKDFEIKEKDSNEPFVKAEEFVLNYQLLPLLSKSLVIDELKLVNARLRVHKNADGTFNFSDIVESQKPAAKDPDKETEFRFSVSNIQLQNGSIDFVDESKEITHIVRQMTVAVPFVSNVRNYNDSICPTLLFGQHQRLHLRG